MKTLLFLFTIGLLSISYLQAGNTFKEEVTLIKDNNYGVNGVDLSFLMKKDEDICEYRYKSGFFSGSFTNKCTKKKYHFRVRDNNMTWVYDYRKWAPCIYMRAYEMMTGKQKMPVGASIIRTVNRKGVIIFCTSDMKICKTDAEVKKYSDRNSSH